MERRGGIDEGNKIKKVVTARLVTRSEEPLSGKYTTTRTGTVYSLQFGYLLLYCWTEKDVGTASWTGRDES